MASNVSRRLDSATLPSLSKSYSLPAEQSQSTSRRPTSSTVGAQTFTTTPTSAPRRQLTRAQSIRETVSHGAAAFFGVPPVSVQEEFEQELRRDDKWTKRRMRHCNRRYGGVRDVPLEQRSATIDWGDQMDSIIEQLPSPPEIPPHPQYAPTSAPMTTTSRGPPSLSSSLSLAGASRDSRPSRLRVLERRDSVAKMLYDGVAGLLSKGSITTPRLSHAATIRSQRIQSASFNPAHLNDITPTSILPTPGFDISNRFTQTSQFGDTLPLERIKEEEESRKNSQAVLSYGSTSGADDNVISEVSARLRDELDLVEGRDDSDGGRVAPMFKRHYDEQVSPRDVHLGRQLAEAQTPLVDDVFFDVAADQTDRPPPVPPHYHKITATGQPDTHIYHQFAIQQYGAGGRPTRPTNLRIKPPPIVPPHGIPDARYVPDRQEVADSEPSVVVRPAARRIRRQAQAAADASQQSRQPSGFFNTLFTWGGRRRIGVGILGKLLGRQYKKRSEFPAHVRHQLDDFDDYRPYFTYWVTTVQILVCILAISLYGFAPVGFGKRTYTANVMHRTLTTNQISYNEQENFWIGPSYIDLVALGAKYSPCMRRDDKVYQQIDQSRAAERNTSCCVMYNVKFHDKSGCFQSSEEDCPKLLASHIKWTAQKPGPLGQTVGSVCGQDSTSCDKPSSISPYEWPNDITKWPICHEISSQPSSLPSMTCELTGRPCCIGMRGICAITTSDYCDYVHGKFHSEATLCSQVSCLEETCGMLPFFRDDQPDQFYRLFIPLFLHADLVQLVITILIQYFFMSDLEKLIGWHRMAIIYMASGIGGNLASAIFVPYQAQAGPAGSHFGLLAALFVDAIYSWKMLSSPSEAIIQLSVVTVILFCIGLLPWVDNWAHTFGFGFGLMLSLALFPYIQFEKHDRTKRIIIIVVSISVSLIIFAMLILFFYFIQIRECSFCEWFNCVRLPFFSEHFCDNQGLQLVNENGAY